MTDARLRVSFAGPLVTFQDAGRPGHMRFGVSASGPMDRLSHTAANVALGNAPDATAIEVSMGGLVLECLDGEVSLSLTGGAFTVDRSGDMFDSWSIFSLSAGEKVTIRPGASGSWAYLAFAGTIEARRWLGHTATHSTSGFGGGQLVTGQTIDITDATLREDRHGTIDRPGFLETGAKMRVVLGPQDQHFTPEAVEAFQSSPFALTDAFDRMGVRLAGPTLDLKAALSLPSEPVTRGSVQVAGDGVPTVLLADHQTTGGYPKIATLISEDIDRISQLRARDPVAFTAITPAEAIQTTRATAVARNVYLDAISHPKGTLSQRLLRENLISGVITGTDPDT